MSIPLGVLCCVTGVSGSGKSTLVNEVLYKVVANRLHRTRQKAGAHKRSHRTRAARQDHLGRPVADRAHPAIQSGHVHRAVRPDPGAVLEDAGGPGARLQAGPVLVQRQGRPVRGVPRRRADQDRDALPARRLRAVRAVPRQALQPRDARGAVQGQDDRRRARDADRGGARVLRPHPEDPPPSGGAERRRARVHAARAAGDDAVGRRGPAGEAGRRAVQGRHRADDLHPRRAHHRPPFRGHPAPARGADAPGRRRQHRCRDRAQPRRDQGLRSDHRPRTRGGRGGRTRDRHRDAGAGGREPGLVHRRVPGRGAARTRVQVGQRRRRKKARRGDAAERRRPAKKASGAANGTAKKASDAANKASGATNGTAKKKQPARRRAAATTG